MLVKSNSRRRVDQMRSFVGCRGWFLLNFDTAVEATMMAVSSMAGIVGKVIGW